MGKHLLNQRLDFLKLKLVIMEDDGNCQFRALSHELYGHQQWHATVRALVVEHMRINPEQYSMYIGTDAEWQQYLQKMAMSRTWGDELTLRAAVDVFGVTVHCVTSE